MRWLLGFGAAIVAGTALAGNAEAQQLADRSARAARYDSRLSAPTTAGTRDRLAESGVEIRLSARFVTASELVRSLVRVAPHQDNRVLRVELDSPDFFRSSDVPLEGELAARNHFFSWKSLPPGSYTLIVTVMGTDGPRTQRVVPFDVIGTSLQLER